MKLLPKEFYQRDTVLVARELIGKRLVRMVGSDMIITTIVETEAYRSDDPACHAYRGKTKRNASLFGPVGHTYVYLSYGIHYCLNLVARDNTCEAGGVLLRGLALESGLAKRADLDGPGKLTQGLLLDGSDGDKDVTQEGDLFVIDGTVQGVIRATPRIGISRGQDALWRFMVE